MHATDEKHARLLVLDSPAPGPRPPGLRRHAASRDVSYTYPAGVSKLSARASRHAISRVRREKLCHFRAPESGWETAPDDVRPAARTRRRSRLVGTNLVSPRSGKARERSEYLGIVADAPRRERSATFVCHVAREDALID